MNNFKLKAIPIFRILEYQKAIDLYIDVLGLLIDWEHRYGLTKPVYMQVSNGEMVLQLSENKRFQTGAIIFVETTGIVEFRKHTESSGKSKLPELELIEWGTKQMELEDPFGNLLGFNEIKA